MRRHTPSDDQPDGDWKVHCLRFVRPPVDTDGEQPVYWPDSLQVIDWMNDPPPMLEDEVTMPYVGGLVVTTEEDQADYAALERLPEDARMHLLMVYAKVIKSVATLHYPEREAFTKAEIWRCEYCRELWPCQTESALQRHGKVYSRPDVNNPYKEHDNT